MKSDLHHLNTLLKSKANITDVVSFHRNVNIIFHDVEAKYYDTLHAEMWESLQPIYNSIVSKININNLQQLKVLDIGCGTGLSAQMLINTPLKQKIKEFHLLDTSNVMLQKSKERFKDSNINFKYFQGELYSFPDEQFDLILISSVLHHIPDLHDFFEIINKKLSSGGFLFHIHDPNGDFIKKNVYLSRIKEFENHAYYTKKKIINRLINKVKGLVPIVKDPDYIGEVNKMLIEKKIIHTELTPQEIWSVTDIHVEGLPYSTNNGISLNELTSTLNNFKLIAAKSYCFYGVMYSKLTRTFRKKELSHFKKNDMNGRNIACLWKKNAMSNNLHSS